MISANLLAVFYLISGVLFILALRGLSSPETSRQGNLIGIIGMAIALLIGYAVGYLLRKLFTEYQIKPLDQSVKYRNFSKFI